MKDFTYLFKYILAGAVVIALGGLGGWYAFVHKQVVTTTAEGVARGFGNATSFGSPAGSSYQNLSGDTGATSTAPAPRLWHVSKTPAAGVAFAASSSKMFFVERATGNILEADPQTSQVVRRTNTLYPKIYDAPLASDGSALLRSLTDSGIITTFSGTIASTSDAQTPAELHGTYLPQNISSIAVLSSKSLFFLVPDSSGGVVGVLSDWSGAKQKSVFASALSQWRAESLSDGSIYLLQKAMDGVSGYSFKLKESTLEPVAQGLGLTLLPRAHSGALIYGSSAGGALNTFARSDTSSSPIRLSIQTVADKCVWAPGSALIAYCAVPKTSPNTQNFLRDWYQGTLHTTDTWWKVDVSAGTSEVLFTSDSSVELDVVNPTIDEKGEYIAFINAADDSLWALRVTP